MLSHALPVAIAFADEELLLYLSEEEERGVSTHIVFPSQTKTRYGIYTPISKNENGDVFHYSSSRIKGMVRSIAPS
jgi:hypothetical protein